MDLQDAETLFPDRQREEGGWPVGFTRSGLVEAVALWHAATFCEDRSPVTVGEAALAFNVPAAFLSEAIDDCGGPWFCAGRAERPEARILEAEGF